MRLKSEEIPIVVRFVRESCGLVLDETKGYLIESRLSTLVEQYGCTDYAQLCTRARADRQLASKVVDAITTQETLFFRDNSPYNALQYKALPELIDAKAGSPFAKRLRIWSAACSTGQEPYSIAMLLLETLPDPHSWNVSVLGTDISDEAVARASRGHYAEHEVRRGLPPAKLQKYFHAEGNGWRINDEVRSLVSFRRLNLLEPLTPLGTFDIIFCRNVAIYFDAPTRDDLFLRLAERLSPEGYLFTGSSESLSNLGPRFAPQHHCQAVFYRPGAPQHAAQA